MPKALDRRSFVPLHDRGRVLVNVAVMIADGGEAIADIDVLGHQAPVLGRVASPATLWRALDEITPGRLKKIAVARAWTRRHVWALLAASEGGFAASRVAGTNLGATVVIHIDATIVISHYEFVDLLHAGRLRTVDEASLPSALRADLTAATAELELPFRPGELHPFVVGWYRMLGLVSIEVSGHLRWALGDATAFVRQQLDDATRSLLLPGPTVGPSEAGQRDSHSAC